MTGAEVEQEESVWKRIVDAAFIGDRVLAVDIKLSNVRIFDLAGHYHGSLGPDGQFRPA